MYFDGSNFGNQVNGVNFKIKIVAPQAFKFDRYVVAMLTTLVAAPQVLWDATMMHYPNQMSGCTTAG